MFIQSNEARCTSCHAGYGWKDKSFDFSSEQNIDCLVCHEQTGTYEKFPTGAGHPVDEPREFGGKMYYPPDWNAAAQSVSLPDRENCGACHFYGGGGDGVKHGDLDSSLLNPSRELDVHMSPEGGDFQCVRCHTTVGHRIAGRCYKIPAFEERTSLIEDDQVHRISCVSCHTTTPHKSGHKANDHTDRVACQTCHIPSFARENPTKMWWDWSTAGRLNEKGKPVVEKGPYGKAVYHGKKGSFRWAKDVPPDYAWFNGRMEYHLITDTIDPDQEPLEINHPLGGKDDPRSLIYPFKIHRGKQPYDTELNTLVNVHLFGSKESDAYWKNFHWPSAIQAGMDYMDLEFSGEYDFIETKYYFPITHMVAPQEDSLSCGSCHAPNGRMSALGGFYMPGRDASGLLDIVGWLVVAGSVLGVGIHALVRIISARMRT
nr:tetrathionate reductase family octaheme c-type cytochrome [Desulfovermiculus halophilus]